MSLPSLFICLILILGFGAWVAWPLRAGRRGRDDHPDGTDTRELALQALRDLEFDRAAGLVGEEDYAAQRATHLAAAVGASRAPDRP
ncbi:MAG: hypothetical protein JNL73_24615 [Anaerolineales bacterium]|nr:hypothetical protein [Anaerolineales bacterium]